MLQSIIAQAVMSHQLLLSSCEQEIQNAIDKYWDARKYPRKKKKALRKQAIKEYAIHTSIHDFLTQCPN